MKQLLSTLLTALLCSSLFSQGFKSNFSFTGGNVGADEIRDITTDAKGNIYITGSFTDSVDFDPGVGTFYLTTPLGNKPDAFIQKLDANGNFLWAKSFRGTYNDEESGYKVAVDDTGNVYLLGYFQRNIFFTFSGYQWPGNSDGTSTRPFLTKLDSNGVVKWGMAWKHSTSSDYFYANSLSLNSKGSVYITGFFNGSLDFDPTLDSIINLTSPGASDAFILEISNSSKVKKAVRYGGTQDVLAEQIVVSNSQEDLFIVGSFKGTVDFDFGVSTQNRTSAGLIDGYILKLDSSLNFIWVYTLGASGLDKVEQIGISPTGYLYASGYFMSTVDFNSGSASNNLTATATSRDVFVLKLDQNHGFIWVKQFAGFYDKRSFGLSVGNNGQVSVVGRMMGTVNFNPGQNYNLTSLGVNDAFVAMLDSTGSFIDAASFGSTLEDYFSATHINANNELLVGGYFQNTIDIDPTATVNLVTSNGLQDFMFFNLGLCGTNRDTLPISSCNNYTLSNGIIITQSGFYLDSLVGSDGCDSNITLDLTIRIINPNVSQTINGLEAASSATNPTYQWMDCATQQIVQGATSQAFMPTANGQYAVIVSDSNCSDTSACFAINNVAIDENNVANSISVFPNPIKYNLTIQSTIQINKIIVLDVIGRTVATFKSDLSTINLSHLKAGLYLVQLHTDSGILVKKVMKE